MRHHSLKSIAELQGKTAKRAGLSQDQASVKRNCVNYAENVSICRHRVLLARMMRGKLRFGTEYLLIAPKVTITC